MIKAIFDWLCVFVVIGFALAVFHIIGYFIHRDFGWAGIGYVCLAITAILMGGRGFYLLINDEVPGMRE